MMTPDTSLYTDLASFTSLRAQAQSNPNEAIDKVAAQFESIFVQMMMKSMRDASEPLESGLMASNQMESYEQMFDQQLSLDLSNGGGLGLAKIIATQLGSTTSASSSVEGSEPHMPMKDLASYRREALPSLNQAPIIPPEQSSIEDLSAVHSLAEQREKEAPQPIVPIHEAPQANLAAMYETLRSDERFNWLPESPKEFVQDLWGFAEKAAEKLGVNPKVILAQAALETGWGKHVIENTDGSSSFNLFGIKAGAGWTGATATVQTLEYENGLAEKQTASFRSYDSLADAFEDYVSFLTGSPRYEQALQGAADDQQYVRGLQDGGYATDPKYAEKILSILSRDEFSLGDIRQDRSELKNSEGVPLI